MNANNGRGFTNGQHNISAQNRGNFAAGNRGTFANQHNVPANSFNRSQSFAANNGMRSYNRENNVRNFSQPAQRSYNMPNRSFAQPNRSFGNQSRSYSTPMARPNFGGNGGGFHGNMGGGGGFHGGGGGGFHGGGGGGFHGGGGGFHGGRR